MISGSKDLIRKKIIARTCFFMLSIVPYEPTLVPEVFLDFSIKKNLWDQGITNPTYTIKKFPSKTCSVNSVMNTVVIRQNRYDKYNQSFILVR